MTNVVSEGFHHASRKLRRVDFGECSQSVPCRAAAKLDIAGGQSRLGQATASGSRDVESIEDTPLIGSYMFILGYKEGVYPPTWPCKGARVRGYLHGVYEEAVERSLDSFHYNQPSTYTVTTYQVRAV